MGVLGYFQFFTTSVELSTSNKNRRKGCENTCSGQFLLFRVLFLVHFRHAERGGVALAVLILTEGCPVHHAVGDFGYLA